MEASQAELFKCMSVGIMFRLGFQSLLTEVACQKGQEADRWLDEFEARVISDAQKMSCGGRVSDHTVNDTVDAAVSEFRKAFAEVRKSLRTDAAGRRHRFRLQERRSEFRQRRSEARRRRRFS